MKGAKTIKSNGSGAIKQGQREGGLMLNCQCHGGKRQRQCNRLVRQWLFTSSSNLMRINLLRGIVLAAKVFKLRIRQIRNCSQIAAVLPIEFGYATAVLKSVSKVASWTELLQIGKEQKVCNQVFSITPNATPQHCVVLNIQLAGTIKFSLDPGHFSLFRHLSPQQR